MCEAVQKSSELNAKVHRLRRPYFQIPNLGPLSVPHTHAHSIVLAGQITWIGHRFPRSLTHQEDGLLSTNVGWP